jgi:hypothetical protein
MRGRNRSAGSGPTTWFGLDGRVRLRGWCQGSIGRVAAGWHGFFDPCRAALDRGVDEDQGVLAQAVSAILRWPKVLRCVAAASAARRVVGFSSGARARVQPRSCPLKALRHLAAAFRELDDDLLVQPDIHFGGAVKLTPVTKLLCQLLARREATVQFQ